LYSTEREDGKFILYTYCKKSAARKWQSTQTCNNYYLNLVFEPAIGYYC
jgi:hypothetical protein